MAQARRITGLMFRTLRAKNSWREGQSFRDISHRLASAGVRSGYCKTRPCSVVCKFHQDCGKARGNSMDQFFRRELATMAARAPRYSCLSVLRRTPLLIALSLSALLCHAADQAIEGARGIVATIDQKSGRYEVRSRELNWKFTGQLGDSASNLSIKNGQDRLGAYRELRFSWRRQAPFDGTIRTYVSRPVVLFGITSKE